MRTKTRFRSKPQMQTERFPALQAATLSLLLPLATWAGGVVNNCTEADLRAAMAGGGTVTFACDGTITLANTITNDTDVTLDGSGHSVTVSGGNAVRVFYVSSNVNLTISSLTIACGRRDTGGGIYNDGGRVSLQNCLLVNNSAVGWAAPDYSGNPGTNGWGGAVRNLGVLNAIHCVFTSNSAFGGNGGSSYIAPGGAGGHGNGGAIWNSGTSILTGCLLTNNCTGGGAGGLGGKGFVGGAGGDGNGGAIGNLGALILSGCLLASNSGTGGVGGLGASGFFPEPYPANSGFPGGSGGGGNGGAVFNNGSAFLVNNTIAFNSGTGGSGGAGGQGAPPMSQSAPSGNGGNGGNGGSGYGAIYDTGGQCYLTNCTVASNPATPGAGGIGGPSGPCPYPPQYCLYGQPGANGATGAAGGGLKTPGAQLLNTLLSSNTPSNCAGTITDAGHNLSSDGTCAFTNAGSLNDTDPKLGPLAVNGGPTLTMALLPGSPAIDAADPAAAPLVDQRGYPRPAGAGPDIGAFEYGSVPLFLSISRSGSTALDLLVRGNANQWCRLLSSSNFNFSSWSAVATNQIGLDGTLLFHQNCGFVEKCRFYRVVPL